MTEREQARFNQTVVALVSKINQRIDDAFANISLSGGGGGGGGGVSPNLLINGGFRVASRGAGPFTNATLWKNDDDSYQLDGCIFLANGSNTCDISQVADADFVSGYKIRLNTKTANRRFGILLPIESQDIQGIRKSGKASVQFKVKCTGVSMSNVRAYLLSWNSTADAITSDVISAWNAAGADPSFVANWTAENAATNIAITTSTALQKIENIAVDTAGVTNLALLLMLDDTDATVGDYLEFGDVKIENGIACTDYVSRPIEQDINMCARFLPYFNGTGATNPLGFGNAISTTLTFHNFFYCTPSRIPCTGLIVESLVPWKVSNGVGTGVAVTAITWNNSSLTTTNLSGTVVAGLIAGQGSLMYSNPTVSRIWFTGAEL